MKYKLLFILSTLLFTSCSITYVSAPKTVCIHGNNNNPNIAGSELKDNEASQSTTLDWFFELPLLK